METGAIRRRSGHWRLRPQHLVADKGYTSHAFRNYLHRKHIRCTIAPRSNERRQGPFSKQDYRKRNVVERLINCLKQFRRLATRYEKRAWIYWYPETRVKILSATLSHKILPSLID